MAEDDDSPDDDAMLSRLKLIEAQPLEHRAAAFGRLHDELRATLEGRDSVAGSV